jgi:predicted 2-oxoglutarate/Fe(II)-dependent dioxygenase YbiX
MNILRQNKQLHPIISTSNFLSNFEINKILDLSKEKNYIEAAVGNELNKEENHNLLTDHKIINPNQGVVKRTRETNLKWISLDKNSNWLFKKIIECINEVNVNNYGYILKFVEDLQFAEYTSQTKGFYSKHIDCGDKYGIENFVDIRKLSFSIQLSSPDEYEGGELKFYTGKKSLYTNMEESTVAKKEKGTIIFFPSFILHEVTPVIKGIRYSLVSWVQGPNLL